jgi:D-arabinose 1-dehydrogenase-like Zn-dependent alcohol dehydrogenase
MPAVRLLRWESEAELVAVPVPEPGPGEVLLKVDAAGLCHTDLHMMEWPAGTVPYTLPYTLGHETAGTVVAFGSGVALGPGARGVSKGDRVLVYARWGCGACWPCLQGDVEPLRGRGGRPWRPRRWGPTPRSPLYHAIKRWLPFGARCTSPPGGRFPS